MEDGSTRRSGPNKGMAWWFDNATKNLVVEQNAFS